MQNFPVLIGTLVWQSVEEARAAGYGITREQVSRGLIGIGVVIRNGRRKPEAALTVVDTIQRMTQAHIEACVSVARRHISALEPLDLAGQIGG